MIRTVISDLGRVVLWFDNAIFLRKLADRAGRPFEAVKATVHGDLGLLRSFDGGAVTPAGFHERVTSAVGATLSYDDFYAMYNDIFTAERPGRSASWPGSRPRATGPCSSPTPTRSASPSSAAASPRSGSSTASSCPTSSSS